MNQKSFGFLSALLGLTLVTSGCPGTSTSDLDLALGASKAALTSEYDADLTAFATLGFTDDKMALATPDYGTDSVMLYGEDAAVTFGREKLKATTKTQGDFLRAIAQDGVIDGIGNFERALVVLGRSEQTDPFLNLPLIRFSYIDLGYRVGHILCLANVHKQLDTGEPLDRTRCDLLMDLGVLSESYAIESLLLGHLQNELKQEGAALGAYLTAIDNVVKLATPANGITAAPSFIQDLSAKTAVLRELVKSRQTQQGSFGERMQQGLAQAGSALASGAALLSAATDPGKDHSASVLGLLAVLENVTTTQSATDADMAGEAGVGTLPQSTMDSLGGAVDTADSAISAAGGGGQDALLAATKQMQETQMSFNLQYLQLQSQMQNENRQYTTISNILKTKHDTVKNSIGNIR